MASLPTAAGEKLSRLRFAVSGGRGRRYPEPAHSYRNDFERDRDRILHARAFRRLEGKTQVFAPVLSDHFRNRLTHTLEVTQIARSVARALALNEDLAEALALVHDIGHPPFAHAGEHQLNLLLQAHGDRFDHNLHALRIVEWFERRYARFPGLNLTFEVREGIVKHSRDFEAGESAELDQYLPGLRPPLEAQLIDLCDEIAYNTADLDDGYAAGLVTIDAIRERLPYLGEIHETVEGFYPGAEEGIQLSESLRALLNWLAVGLIEGTTAAVEQSGVETVEDVRRHPVRLARFTAETAAMTANLKAFLREAVYHAEPVREERADSMQRIARLFGYFLETGGSMPENYEDAAAESGMLRHRVVCDYIAGMTDAYFNRKYDQVFERD